MSNKREVFSPTSVGQKQANLTVNSTTGQTISATLVRNATTINTSANNVAALSFSPTATYNPLTNQAHLPSVAIAGNTMQQFNKVTLCPKGNEFEMCGADTANDTISSSQIGNSVFNPSTNIAEIPVIRVQGTTNDNVGVSLSAYSVALKLNDKL